MSDVGADRMSGPVWSGPGSGLFFIRSGFSPKIGQNRITSFEILNLDFVDQERRSWTK
jgi:hypothetical protein